VNDVLYILTCRTSKYYFQCLYNCVLEKNTKKHSFLKWLLCALAIPIITFSFFILIKAGYLTNVMQLDIVYSAGNQYENIL